MGSGSSRSGRALRRRRSADRHPGPGGDGGAGRSRATAAEAGAAAAQAAAEAASQDPGPAAPPDGGDETLRLLDQLLAESATWGSAHPAPRRPAPPRPAAGAASSVSTEQSVAGGPESVRVSGAPGSSPKSPRKQSAVCYDHAEEELMASIEREYCH